VAGGGELRRRRDFSGPVVVIVVIVDGRDIDDGPNVVVVVVVVVIVVVVIVDGRDIHDGPVPLGRAGVDDVEHDLRHDIAANRHVMMFVDANPQSTERVVGQGTKESLCEKGCQFSPPTPQ